MHEETYDEDLREKFNRQVIPPEYSEELLIYMLGWVYEKVHQYTKINEPAYIKSTEYREALLKEVRGLNTSAILSAVSSVPNYQETGDEVSRRDVYIKQLELIEMDSTELFSAASDYLRTKAEVTAWARKGLVTDSSFSDYNDSLIRIWKNEKIHTELMPYDSVGKGRLLYSKCNTAVTNKPLQGKTVPSFFGSGSLYALANEPSEQPKIGWHPNYVDMLKEENDE